MNRAKQLSTISKKLTSVPELLHKKAPLNSSPMLKENRKAKPIQIKIESMVLRSPPTGESIVRFALPIPSVRTKEILSGEEMLKNITKQLKAVVSTLEDTYGIATEEEELIGKRKESSPLSVGDEMSSFLLCCSEFAATLEEAVNEEHDILDSLFKWFQQQVNQIEEMSRDQSILEADFKSDQNLVNGGFKQIVDLMHKFQDLKARLSKRKVSLQSRNTDRDNVSDTLRSYEAIEKQVEEFIKAHPAFSIRTPTETETESGSDQPAGTTESEQPADTTEPSSVISRMNMMMKIFENQTSMLEKALNDQSLIETKYKEMAAEYHLLLLEKSVLENEIQKRRDAEKRKVLAKEDRKKASRTERKKDRDSERISSQRRDNKAYEELQLIQKEAETLKVQKKTLQEQLRWALQEAERNKTQLEYILHEEMELLKEDMSKAKYETISHYEPGERGKQRKDYDQVVLAQDKSSVRKQSISAALNTSASESAYDVSDGKSLPRGFLSESSKSLTVPLIEEPPQDETEKQHLEPEEAGESEQFKSHTELEYHKGSKEILNENLSAEDKELLPDAQAPTVQRLKTKLERKSHEEGSDRVDYEESTKGKAPEKRKDSSKGKGLTSREEGSDRVNYEESTKGKAPTKRKDSSKEKGLTAHEEGSDRVDYEESTKGKAPEKRKDSSRGKGLTAREEGSDRVDYEESTKGKAPAKRKDSSKGKGLTFSDADNDGVTSPRIQGSLSRVDIQTKKQKTQKKQTGSTEVPDKNIEQDPDSKFQTQTKKLKVIKQESVTSEVSDRSFKLEDQTKLPIPQPQLKKQKSVGGETFTIHFTATDDLSTRLQEPKSEVSVQGERATTSADTKLSTISVDYQKKEVSTDSLFPDKKLLVTRNQAQQQKYYLPRDDNVQSQNIELRSDENYMSVDSTSKDHPQFKKLKTAHIENTCNMDVNTGYDIQETKDMAQQRLKNQTVSFMEVQVLPDLEQSQPLIDDIFAQADMNIVVETDIEKLKEISDKHLKSDLKKQSKSGSETATTVKRKPKKFKAKEPVKTESQTQEDDNLNLIKGMKVLEMLKAQDTSSSPNKIVLISKENISPDLNSLKTKPQQSINAKPNIPKKFPTKVVNLSNFLSEETSSEYSDTMSKPLYRTSRGSSALQPAAIQDLVNRRISGDPKTADIHKQSTELESQRMSITSTKVYTYKGQSKLRKLKKKGVVTSTSMRTSTSFIKKKKSKEQHKFVNLIERGVELPNDQKISPKIKVIKELSETNVDSEGELPNSLFKSRAEKEQARLINLNDSDAIILYHLHGSTSSTCKDLTTELSKLHFYGGSTSKLYKSKSATRKRGVKDKEDVKDTDSMKIGKLPATVSKKLKEPSKPRDLGKKATKDKNILRASASTIKKLLSKESSKPSYPEKKRAKKAKSLNKSISSLKKHMQKEQSKTKDLKRKVVESARILRISAAAKKKSMLKGSSKIGNLQKHIVRGTGIFRKTPSAMKKFVSKDLFKRVNLDETLSPSLSSLDISASPPKKNKLKGHLKQLKRDKKGNNLQNYVRPSASATSNLGLKGKLKSSNASERSSERPNNLPTSPSTTRKRLLKVSNTIR